MVIDTYMDGNLNANMQELKQNKESNNRYWETEIKMAMNDLL